MLLFFTIRLLNWAQLWTCSSQCVVLLLITCSLSFPSLLPHLFPVFSLLCCQILLKAGERNGNPLQYSWLGKPMDRAAWSMVSQRVEHNSATKQNGNNKNPKAGTVLDTSDGQ